MDMVKVRVRDRVRDGLGIKLGLGLGLGPLGWWTGVIVCCLLAYVASGLVWYQYGWVSRNTSPAAPAPNIW